MKKLILLFLFPIVAFAAPTYVGNFNGNGTSLSNVVGLSAFTPLTTMMGNSTSQSGSRRVGKTNVIGFGQVFNFTGEVEGQAAWVLTNRLHLIDAILTNNVLQHENSLIRVTNGFNPDRVVISDSKLYGKSRSIYFHGQDNDGVWTYDLNNVELYSKYIGLEAWYAYGQMLGGRIVIDGSGQVDSIGAIMNDDASVSFRNVEFYFGGASGINAALLLYARANVIMENCSLHSTNLNSVAVYVAEGAVAQPTTLAMKSVTFYHNGGAFMAGLPEAGYENGGFMIDMIDVNMSPYTNKVLVWNTNFLVRVRDGNFTRENFACITNVVWADAWNPLTNTLAVDTWYTNGFAPTLNLIRFTSAASLEGDASILDLQVDQNHDNVIDWLDTCMLYTPTAVTAGSMTFNFVLEPFARYRFSTASASASVTFEFRARQTVAK